MVAPHEQMMRRAMKKADEDGAPWSGIGMLRPMPLIVALALLTYTATKVIS